MRQDFIIEGCNGECNERTKTSQDLSDTGGKEKTCPLWRFLRFYVFSILFKRPMFMESQYQVCNIVVHCCTCTWYCTHDEHHSKILWKIILHLIFCGKAFQLSIHPTIKFFITNTTFSQNRINTQHPNGFVKWINHKNIFLVNCIIFFNQIVFIWFNFGG